MSGLRLRHRRVLCKRTSRSAEGFSYELSLYELPSANDRPATKCASQRVAILPKSRDIRHCACSRHDRQEWPGGYSQPSSDNKALRAEVEVAINLSKFETRCGG